MLHPELLDTLIRERERRLRVAADDRRLAAVARPKRRSPLASLAVGWLGQAVRARRPRRAAVDGPLPAPTNRFAATG